MSAAYDKNADHLSSTFDKLNLRVNNTFKPHKKMGFNLSVYYTGSKSVTGKPPFSTLTGINGRYIPYMPFVGLEGDFNRKGSSAFAGRIGQRVAAKGVDRAGRRHHRRPPWLAQRPTTRATRPSATCWIEDGILKGYIQVASKATSTAKARAPLLAASASAWPPRAWTVLDDVRKLRTTDP
ncbi:hypothetical protein [Mycobacterium tuberculosis]|uniref:hypothetical protein n=1 Tax=Mycobacterium tuberculosis TaxID=1773 RepID=UPI00272DC1A8|nr:hypothetical protein [Mycobacterium tuberculosis]